MQAVGKLLIIWGVLIPAIAFPWMRGFDPAHGLLGSVRWMFADIGGTRIIFHQVLSGGLVLVGVGLSLMVGRRGRGA